ncbi:hypothetical protein [Bradyrhizobium sp. STM 3809]|uniref:hypothetical protein n=1 Tax=Bradyrhizobium sp. STM 3809 TaxID=551936 RepID=UPI0002409320|nr:hypothetical protein [Bradyrhizobium sp. STM 3809]CCE01181.1 conserved hypothetical protein [Bradyrhizobium sp. STM 3809]
MKILCTVTLSPTADRAEVAHRLSEELRESWALYLGGIIREAYQTDDPAQIVFVLETADIPAAEAALDRLPLVRGGSFTCQLTALRPFSNWARMFATP